MQIEEVCKRIMYVLDAIDEHIHTHYPGTELELLTGILLEFSSKLDPQGTIPEPDHTFTLKEAIELLST